MLKNPSSPHRPRKRFGQNFLHDVTVIQKIIAAIHPIDTDAIVEIGPGLGALTNSLLPLVKKMDAIEIDRDLIPLIAKKAASLGDLALHQADALNFDFLQLHQERGAVLRVIGNLPYNVATPLIFYLLHQMAAIKDMHFMIQKEVADRICAMPGNGDYGRLSVMVQYFCQAERLFTVGSGAFTPSPAVESAFIRLIPYAELPYSCYDFPIFEKTVKQAFGQRRKTLRNSLKGLLNAEQLKSVGIDPMWRAEQLSLENFVAISNVVASLEMGRMK